MMKATISTIIQTNATRMWQELQKIRSLMAVASPILVFKPQKGQRLPPTWEVGQNYALDLFAFHIFPLGKHYIYVKQIDAQKGEIYTNEHGSLTKIWNHRIQIEPLHESTLRYTDEIEIGAGILTPFIWAFAHIFYRHRQRMWKKQLAS
jgi:hypothetical protein